MVRRRKKPVLPFPVPGAVHAVAERLATAGGRCWVVGGAVRDGLLGHPAADWDLATDLVPARWREVLPEADPRDATHGVGHLRGETGEIVLTTLRTEGDYLDHRRPSTVVFTDRVAVDAPRRDFTVNALYLDLQEGVLIDPCGGRADLEARLLRVIGAPEERLREDPLRILRAVRFMARCGLQPHPDTGRALAELAGELVHLAPERVFAELTDLFTGLGRGRGLHTLVATGVAPGVLPEVVPMAGVPQPPEFHPEGDVLTHVCLVLDHVPAGNPVLSWAAVLHDTGKPATFERATDRIRFHGHDVLSARLAEQVLRRLRAPRELRETVVEVCRDHIRFASLAVMRPGIRDKWLRSPRFGAHLEFHRADCLGSHGRLQLYEAMVAARADLAPLAPPPLCQGRDVLALGVPEGPVVGQVLKQVQAEVESGGIVDREQALALLARLVAGLVKDS